MEASVAAIVDSVELGEGWQGQGQGGQETIVLISGFGAKGGRRAPCNMVRAILEGAIGVAGPDVS